MIYFLAFGEFTKYVKINRSNIKPKSIINKLKKTNNDFIVLFKCGIKYNANLRKFNLNPITGGRKKGKNHYKELMKIKLSEYRY